MTNNESFQESPGQWKQTCPPRSRCTWAHFDAAFIGSNEKELFGIESRTLCSMWTGLTSGCARADFFLHWSKVSAVFQLSLLFSIVEDWPFNVRNCPRLHVYCDSRDDRKSPPCSSSVKRGPTRAAPSDNCLFRKWCRASIREAVHERLRHILRLKPKKQDW
jgi:hypothetical protein